MKAKTRDYTPPPTHGRLQKIVANINEGKEISFVPQISPYIQKAKAVRCNPLSAPLLLTYKITALETVVKGKF